MRNALATSWFSTISTFIPNESGSFRPIGRNHGGSTQQPINRMLTAKFRGFEKVELIEKE